MQNKTETKFDKDKAISDVIQRFNYIESMINSVILERIKPSKENFSFTKDVVLHNSIMSFGGKLKLIKIINNEINVIKEFYNLHRLINIRNAFAHSPDLKMKPGFKFPACFPIKFEYHVTITGGKKVIELEPMEALYIDFVKIYDSVKKDLDVFLTTVKKQYSK